LLRRQGDPSRSGFGSPLIRARAASDPCHTHTQSDCCAASPRPVRPHTSTVREQTRSGPPQPAHAQPCRAAPGRRYTSTALKAHWRGARVRCACSAKRSRGVLALRQQDATAQSRARSGAAAGRGDVAVAVEGWRRWSHKAEERWARQWMRICEAVRAGAARAGKGCGTHLVGHGGDRRAENVEDESESNERLEARASVADAAQSEGGAVRVCRRSTFRSCGYFARDELTNVSSQLDKHICRLRGARTKARRYGGGTANAGRLRGYIYMRGSWISLSTLGLMRWMMAAWRAAAFWNDGSHSLPRAPARA
jgi:hypothetical protein